MDAKTKFDRIIKRARGLCDLHERLEANGVPGDPTPGLLLDDVLRSALMLAVSAFDAYFRDKFLERLIPYAKDYKATDTLNEALVNAGVTLTDLIELLGKKRPHRTLRNKVAAWLLSKPMHDLHQVDDLYQGLGIKQLTTNAAKKDGAATIRSKTVATTKRRHDIVHYGDYFSGKASLRPVDRATTLRQIDWVQRLVDESEAIINSATKKKAAKPKKKAAKPKKKAAKSKKTTKKRKKKKATKSKRKTTKRKKKATQSKKTAAKRKKKSTSRKRKRSRKSRRR